MPQTNESEKSQPLPFLGEKFQEPPLYKVILHNDDYTTMDFVVSVLVDIFKKSLEEAERIMLTVHKQQKALVGIYIKEIAEVRVERTMAKAREHGFPLLCTFEPDDNTKENI